MFRLWPYHSMAKQILHGKKVARIFTNSIILQLSFQWSWLQEYSFCDKISVHLNSVERNHKSLKKLVRIFFLIFFMCLFIGTAPDFIPNANASFEMTASEACIQFIKDFEGFSPKPYYDYSQHTVGYGTKCPTEKYFDYMADGISREEAEWLLREEITSVEADIHEKLIVPYNLIFTQNQFDALVSFSFNIGTGWMTYDSTLRNALLRNVSEDELVYAFSLYSTAGGNYLSGLITRRLCEANMFLNGVYSKTANDSYGYVLYEPNGGTLTYRVQGYVCGHNPLPVADAVRAGDVFLGWYTDLTGGTKVTELNRTLSGKTLFARWESSEAPENEDSYAMMIQVTGDVVNIRKGPGTNYGIAKQVRRNDTLLLSHVTQLTNMKWGKVQDGWICLDYTNYDDLINGTDSGKEDNTVPPSDDSTDSDYYPVTPDAVTGTVRVNDLLRIRSGPGTTYSTVGHLDPIPITIKQLCLRRIQQILLVKPRVFHSKEKLQQMCYGFGQVRVLTIPS